MQKPKMTFGKIFLLLTVVTGLCGLWAYWMWKSEPVYWQERREYLQQTTPAQRMAIAESIEQRLLNKLNLASGSAHQAQGTGGGMQIMTAGDSPPGVQRAGDPQATEQDIFLTTDEMNAWMDQRLTDWAGNQGIRIPPFVESPMLAVEGENLVIAFKVVKPPIRQIMSIVCEVVIDSGQATTRVMSVRGGRLKLPGVQAASSVLQNSQSESKFAQTAAKIKEAFDGKSFDPVLKLSNQKIQLVAFKLKKDGAMLTVKPQTKKK